GKDVGAGGGGGARGGGSRAPTTALVVHRRGQHQIARPEHGIQGAAEAAAQHQPGPFAVHRAARSPAHPQAEGDEIVAADPSAGPVPGEREPEGPRHAAQLPVERDQDQDRPRLVPAAVGRGLARLELALAALPHLVRLPGRVFPGEVDARDLREIDAQAPRSRLVVHLEVRGAAIVHKPDQRGAVVAPERDVPAVVERSLYQLRQTRIGHSWPVTMAAKVAPIVRGESNAARTALGSNPQCTMQSWQRGLPLLRPYFDQSVSSISSRKVFAYPSCKR